MASADRVPVPGSERSPLAAAEAVGTADPAQPLEVTVVVRRKPGAVQAHAAHPLSRDEFESRHGADAADLAQVEAFARDRGLRVVEASPARRSVVLSGTVADMGAAFGVDLVHYRHPDGDFRGRTGPVYVPAELGQIVEGVFGLDDRPQSRPHFRRLAISGPIRPHAAPSGWFTPVEVARLYGFPTGPTGAGQTIALIELGGGYRDADLHAYFDWLGIAPPSVVAVAVDGGNNMPTGDPSGPDGEVVLDIEIAGAIAPGARLAVYFAPNTERGFVDAVAAAVHDRVNHPTAVSISWGGPEESWTAQGRAALDAVFQDAGALGVTVCCASGDDGSSDRVSDGLAHTDFPASSPHALACGGTRLEGSGGSISSEVAWNDGPGGGSTGGGVSAAFALPGWQAAAGVPPSANPGGRAGRGVPDVSGDADPQTGYRVLADGVESVVGGTSAVAPLWAGLIALLNEALGRPAGFLNPLLYGALRGTLRDITSGDNGAYAAGRGWDACTGLGSPDGAALLRGLSGLHRAGG